MPERPIPSLELLQGVIDEAKDTEPQFTDGWDELGRYARFLASEGRIPSTEIAVTLEPEHRIYRHRHFDFDIDGHSVIVDGERTTLTKMNFDLLNYLVSRPNKVVSRGTLVDKVWENYGSMSTVNVHISKLRKILKGNRSEDPEIIRTVQGAGYMFYDERLDPNANS